MSSKMEEELIGGGRLRAEKKHPIAEKLRKMRMAGVRQQLAQGQRLGEGTGGRVVVPGRPGRSN